MRRVAAGESGAGTLGLGRLRGCSRKLQDPVSRRFYRASSGARVRLASDRDTLQLPGVRVPGALVLGAYDVKTRKAGPGVIYSISILSELPWKKTDPYGFIEMTVVDDGGLRLSALKSSFVV